MKILIVEDEPSLREIMVRTLTREQYIVEQAADYAAALDKIAAYDYDCILLDIMLPVMDGWSVLKKIRENDKTPVIMLTAKGETQDKVAGLEGGADDYIVKPFEMKEVLARIHAVLRRTGQEEEQGDRSCPLISWSSTWTPMSCWWTASGWIRPLRSWSCSIIWPLRPPGVYPEPAAGRGVGLRLLRRFPYRGRAYQAPAGEAGGRQRAVEPQNRVGCRLQV